MLAPAGKAFSSQTSIFFVILDKSADASRICALVSDAIQFFNLSHLVHLHFSNSLSPAQLMHMMTYAEAQCATDPNFCVAWTHGGSAFVVQDPDAFTKDVVPRFFKATKFASFTRKLYRWGFRQINRGSTSPTDPMIFSNDNFHRDHKHLMANMRSTTNKKQKLNNATANNANPTMAFPHGLGMGGFNNFSALPPMDGSGVVNVPGMAAMAGMGMAFPPGMAMSMMHNNAAMMMPPTVTAGTNTPDGGAGMAAGSGTISPNSGVAAVSAGMKRKAQEDILDSLDPTKAPGWNQLPSEERIRILQQALDTTATRFAAANAEQQREDSFGSAAASSASMPSTTPPTAPGSSLPHLDQLQNFQQELMFNQGQQAVAQSSLQQQQQSFSRTTLAERLRTAHQKYTMPLPQDITSQQQVASSEVNVAGTYQGLVSLPSTDATKTTMMGSLPNTGLNSMIAPHTGMMPATDLQQQQQQQAGGFGNVQ